jgi:putative flavoprotein involved in K+ transport
VGSGSSGCQIAEELARNDRRVYLSVGNCGWGPRRYRGRDFMRWAIDLGLMDETVDRSPDARLACNQSLSGNDGGHDCHPRTLARLGVVLVGRLEGIRGRTFHLRPDLDENLAKADEFAERFKRQVDEHVLAAQLDVPDTPADDAPPSKPASADRRREIDLDRSGISTILWANGYRPDFDWIELPLFDNDGWPGQVRGVTRSAGLYFLGLHWLYKRKSSLLFGVGEDAEFITNHIVRASAGPRSRLPRHPPHSQNKRALLQ